MADFSSWRGGGRHQAEDAVSPLPLTSASPSHGLGLSPMKPGEEDFLMSGLNSNQSKNTNFWSNTLSTGTGAGKGFWSSNGLATGGSTGSGAESFALKSATTPTPVEQRKRGGGGDSSNSKSSKGGRKMKKKSSLGSSGGWSVADEESAAAAPEGLVDRLVNSLSGNKGASSPAPPQAPQPKTQKKKAAPKAAAAKTKTPEPKAKVPKAKTKVPKAKAAAPKSPGPKSASKATKVTKTVPKAVPKAAPMAAKAKVSRRKEVVEESEDDDGSSYSGSESSSGSESGSEYSSGSGSSGSDSEARPATASRGGSGRFPAQGDAGSAFSPMEDGEALQSGATSVGSSPVMNMGEEGQGERGGSSSTGRGGGHSRSNSQHSSGSGAILKGLSREDALRGFRTMYVEGNGCAARKKRRSNIAKSDKRRVRYNSKEESIMWSGGLHLLGGASKRQIAVRDIKKISQVKNVVLLKTLRSWVQFELTTEDEAVTLARAVQELDTPAKRAEWKKSLAARAPAAKA